MSVKLHNNSQRTIEYGKGNYFKPNQKLEFPDDVAAKLQRLYPSELQSLESVMKAFNEAPAAQSEDSPKVEEDSKVVVKKSSTKGDEKPAV